MCGIVGITTSKTSVAVAREIIESLKRLEYRGYDSVGVAVICDQQVNVKKGKGKIVEVTSTVNFSELKGLTGIGHTRWATHGKPSRENSHPHLDQNNKIAVVHNGIVENFMELREDLIKKGHIFSSETDTEVIPHLLAEFQKQGMDMKDAIKKALETIHGTFALAIISGDHPGTIWCVKRDNPLVLGINDNMMFCASDIPAFLNHTREVIILKNDELVTLSPQGYEMEDLRTGVAISRKPHRISWEPEMAQKGGYPHFMLKEIHEQPATLQSFIRNQRDNVADFARRLIEADKVILLAAGTAHYSTLSGSKQIMEYLKIPTYSAVASEFSTYLPIITEKTAIVPVSQSGETLDTIMAIKAAKERGAKVYSIINVVGSTITTYSDAVLYLQAGPEIGVASTKAYTLMCLALWCIGYEIAKQQKLLNEQELQEYDHAISTVPQAVSDVINQCEYDAQQIAESLKRKTSAFFLGRGYGLQTAFEGALKMKEIAYVHCEAYAAGESKHGPIALVEKGFPVIAVLPSDDTRQHMISNIMEMKARGAYIIAVREQGDTGVEGIADVSFEIPQGYSKFVSTVPYVVPLQLLAYYVAVSLGLDVDMPRNLAKAVTVQ